VGWRRSAEKELAMMVGKVLTDKLPALLLRFMIAGYAISSCAASGLRTVTPSNAPPDISYQMPPDDAPVHQGMSIGGRGYSGHEIVAPAEGVVVFSRDYHIRIHHGLDSNKQDMYTEHFHVQGRLLKEGDKVRRGQNIGLIGEGKNTSLPHYHYVVVKMAGLRKFIALNAIDYWFGIDQYKENLEKGLDIGPFVIPCFDPNVNYPTEARRFTYPAKCK